MSISACYRFLQRIDLLDENLMTALELDALFNEFNVEYINFDQFMELISKFSTMKMMDKNFVIKFIIQQLFLQVHSLEPTGEESDKLSESSKSTISSRSDVSNAYTYYPRHDPRHKCLDELCCSDDGGEDGDERGLDADDDDIHPPSIQSELESESALHHDGHSHYEDENEDGGEYY
ncbi:hypothetical protein WDU94_014401 [Cyamophila willieti]